MFKRNTLTSPLIIMADRQDSFCVLLEVTDLEITGLSAYLFREICREMNGYVTIHAMGDAGLERLCKAKLSYSSSKILTSYIATQYNKLHKK